MDVELAANPQQNIPSAAYTADAKMDVENAIRSLSPAHREVVLFRELKGLSYDEIAEVLGLPRGTVESRLFRARQHLKQLLKDYLTYE